MGVIVDTNVAVVANGRSAQASVNCVLACVHRLGEIKQGTESLVLDDGWHIIGEYQRNLCPSGQPGVGDAFLKWVLTNQANPKRCEHVHITPSAANETGWEEFPADPELSGFDRSDRKFVAVALAHSQRPPILNAVDKHWWDYREALERNGVRSELLCQEMIAAWDRT